MDIELRTATGVESLDDLLRGLISPGSSASTVT
jgi:hypothetical protein